MKMNEVNKQMNQKNQKSLSCLCPFVQDPHRDRYCFDMCAQEIIMKSIYYCMENFIECETWERLSLEAMKPKDESDE